MGGIPVKPGIAALNVEDAIPTPFDGCRGRWHRFRLLRLLFVISEKEVVEDEMPPAEVGKQDTVLRYVELDPRASGPGWKMGPAAQIRS